MGTDEDATTGAADGAHTMATSTTSPAVVQPPATRRPAIRWQKAIIRSIVAQTARVKSFFVELSQPFNFIAGQHVDVRLTAPDGYQAQRSYSIASAPGAGNTIEITVERLDDGEVSPFFHDVAVEGDEIELRGPIGGYFIWRTDDGGPILLAGGGSGIVPLMSIVRHRSGRHAQVPMVLLFSARTWDDIIYRDELMALAAQRDGFELVLTLTRADAFANASVTGAAGAFSRRVDREMAAHVLKRLPQAPKQAYLCGSNPFVEAASESLIAAGVASSLIRIERYGG